MLKVHPGSFLLFIVKCKRKKIEKLVREKEPGLDDLGNAQLIKIAKDVKIRRFTVRRACFGEKNQEYNWTGLPWWHSG